MVVEFSAVPIGTGAVSLSREVAELVDIIEQSGLPYSLGAMGTTVEGTWEEVMPVIRKCHDRMGSHTGRVVTRIVIDDRAGAKERLSGKIASVNVRRRAASGA